MKERPILFKGEMVRALLDGRKTQTRRLMKPQPVPWSANPAFLLIGDGEPMTLSMVEARCPYGVPGDRLWVKETWRPRTSHSHRDDACDCADVVIKYNADGEERFFEEASMPNERRIPKAARAGNVSPLLMPRWASRLTLEVTGIRVERLQDISEEDAKAEGVMAPAVRVDGDLAPAFDMGSPYTGPRELRHVFRCEFATLWDEINGKRAPWSTNPWLWVVGFRVLEARAGGKAA